MSAASAFAAAAALASSWWASPAELVVAMSLLMLATGAASFIGLQFLRAPYGKYVGEAGGAWGFLVDGRLAWLLQEAPSFLVPAALWWHAAAAAAPAPAAAALTRVSPRTLLLGAFLLHYFHRAFIFPLRLRGGKPTPVGIAAMAFAFCVFNGVLQGVALTRLPAAPPPGGAAAEAAAMAEPHFVLGLAIMAAGAAINLHADTILLNLRAPGDRGYYIPRGGFFEYVSGANFFGEMLEWAGWALAAGTLPAAAFALFTACNIGPRACQHHAWLRAKFGDKYPRARAAVIPFLW